MKIITLCSGGLDSVVLAYYLASKGYDQTLLHIYYGQRHHKESLFAEMCASRLGVPYEIVRIAGNIFDGSALTDLTKDIPTGEYTEESLKTTIVPNRNMVFASLAGALAVATNSDGIALAAHAGDHAIYPDCRPEFVTGLVEMLHIATGRSIEVLAPWLKLTKAEIVSKGSLLEVIFTDTWSCYEGGLLHCGICSTCVERKRAFELAEVPDPTRYELHPCLKLSKKECEKLYLGTFEKGGNQ